MSILQRFFSLFWISCCALAMLLQTRALLNLPLTPGWVDGFVFGATVFGYHVNHAKGYYRLIVFAAGCLGAVCFGMTLLEVPHPIQWMLITGVPMLFWLAYYGLSKNGKTGLRALPLAKPIVIALTWSWVTVLYAAPPERWPEMVFIFLGRTVFIFALALAYDLVDADYDRRHGLNTLTGKLGFGRSFLLIYSSLAFCAFCAFANFYFDIFGLTTSIKLLYSLVFSAWWLHYLIQKQSWGYWRKVLIDALMVLQCVLVVLSQKGINPL